MFEGNQLCSSPAEYHPKVKCAGSSLMRWGCFSAAGTEGLIRIEEKLNAPKILRHSEPQTGQKVTFQQDSDPKHTARVAYTQRCECLGPATAWT